MWKIEKPLENRNGVLFIGGCSVIDLAKKFGTPLYIYDENRIIENYQRLFNAFSSQYKKFKILYALKANPNLEILKVLQKQGSCADVSSPFEIRLAKLAGMSDMLYTGAYYSDEELQFGLDEKVSINLEDISQIDRLARFGFPEFISFRVNPGFGKGKFEGLVTAGKHAKFGIPEKDIIEAYRKAKQHGAKRFGIHTMAGSCVLDEDHFVKVAEKMVDVAGRIAKELKIKFDFIDLGGGFGIPYEPGEDDLNIESMAKKVVNKFKEKLKEHDLGEPYLFTEPGRYIIGDACILLAKVNSIKKTEKTFIGLDAGMNSLIRPMIYGAYHHIVVANKLNAEKQKVNIVGPICENTDTFAKDRMLEKAEVNDFIAVFNAGAYGYSMASDYNVRARPAEVLVKDGDARIIRNRETFEDLK